MADRSILPSPTPDQRRIAAGQFERANQVIATGHYDYGIQLLLNCCRLDPANLIYRQLLRRTEKTKYKNNMRGGWLAWLRTWPAKLRLKAAQRVRDYLKVLEYGERVLVRNPWDTGTQLAMARAAEVLGLFDLAAWTLEQARQKSPRDVAINRALAQLYERSGNFTQAIQLWDLIHRTDPNDEEAAKKIKDLSARDTIVRGHSEEVVGGGPRPRTAGARDTKKDDDEDSTRELSEAGPDAALRLPETIDPVALPLRERIQADPTNAEAYLQLAAFYRRAGQLDQARQVLEFGLGPTGNRFELLMELIDLQIEPFRRNLALTEEKLQAHPDNEELRRIRVRLLKEINTRELEMYRQKADRQPAEMSHRFELGLRLLRAGQIDEAIRELQLARSDMRLKWRSLLYLGYCFKARNNWRLAERNFEEALQNLPIGETAARKEILFQLAQGAADAGDLNRAVEMGLELANLDFAYRDIGRLLDEWQDRLQNADVS